MTMRIAMRIETGLCRFIVDAQNSRGENSRTQSATIFEKIFRSRAE